MIEKFLSQRLAINSIDKMLTLVFICVVLTALNNIKSKENNRRTSELLEIISAL